MTVKNNTRLISAVINNEFTKLIEVTKTGRSMTVHKTMTLPTPKSCIEDGVVTDEITLGKAIREVLDENKIKVTDICFSITSSKIATKEVIIPYIKDPKKVKQLISANASEYFPVNIDEYVVEHNILEQFEDEGEQKLKVMVAACPSDLALTYYRLARVLGMKVAFIDYTGNSTNKLVAEQIGSQLSMVIEIESDSTMVGFFKNNVLQFQRLVPYGKSLLVNATMQQYGLSYDDALQKLQTQTVLHARFDGDPVTESVRYLVSNVNRIVDYYVSRNKEPIQAAYVIGNATKIGSFVNLLAKECNLKLSSIDYIRNVYGDKKTYVSEADLTSYIPNIGALIDPVNFVPASLTESEKKKDSARGLVVLVIASIVIAAVLVAIPLVQCISLSSEISARKQNIAKLKSVESTVNEYYEAKDMYTDVAAYAALTTDNDDSLGDFVKYLEACLPSTMTVTSMNVTSGAVSISGQAETKSQLAKFIQGLQTVPSVTGVFLTNESESKDNADKIVIEYSLTCNFGDITGSNSTTTTTASSTK